MKDSKRSSFKANESNSRNRRKRSRSKSRGRYKSTINNKSNSDVLDNMIPGKNLYSSEKKTSPSNNKKNFNMIERTSLDFDDSLPRIVVIDHDDFYGLTVDLALHNFKNHAAVLVNNLKQLEHFIKIQGPELAKNQSQFIFLIDELFEFGKKTRTEFIDLVKQSFPESTFVGLTTLSSADIKDVQLFDNVIVKSSRHNHKTLIKTMSDLLGIDYEENNSDPEIE